MQPPIREVINPCPYCGRNKELTVHHFCTTTMLTEWPELNTIARKLYHGNLTGAQKLVNEFYAKHRKLSQYDPSDNDEVEI